MKNSKKIPQLQFQLVSSPSATPQNTPRCCLSYLQNNNTQINQQTKPTFTTKMQRVRSMGGLTQPSQQFSKNSEMQSFMGWNNMDHRLGMPKNKQNHGLRISLKRDRNISVLQSLKQPTLNSQFKFQGYTHRYDNNNLDNRKRIKGCQTIVKQQEYSNNQIPNKNIFTKTDNTTGNIKIPPKFHYSNQQKIPQISIKSARPQRLQLQSINSPKALNLKQRCMQNRDHFFNNIKSAKSLGLTSNSDQLSPRVVSFLDPHARFHESILFSQSNNSFNNSPQISPLSPKFQNLRKQLNLNCSRPTQLYKESLLDERYPILQRSPSPYRQLNQEESGQQNWQKTENNSELISTEISPSFSFCSNILKQKQEFRAAQTLDLQLSLKKRQLPRISQKNESLNNQTLFSSHHSNKVLRKNSPKNKLKSLNTMNTVKSYADSDDSGPLLKNKQKIDQSVVVVDFFKSNPFVRQNEARQMNSPRYQCTYVSDKQRSISQYMK